MPTQVETALETVLEELMQKPPAVHAKLPVLDLLQPLTKTIALIDVLMSAQLSHSITPTTQVGHVCPVALLDMLTIKLRRAFQFALQYGITTPTFPTVYASSFAQTAPLV